MVKDRVLIADDSKLNQKLLTAILGNKYDYLYADNGYEIIDILNKNEAIDIILLDINMPKMNGFEVLKYLNEKKYIEYIPVVIISIENDEDFVKKAYELGATDYIPRPFNSIVVTHRVKNTLMLYSNQKKLVRLVENQIYEREKTNNAMINIFSNIIELRNHESGSHTLHVQVITNLLLHKLTTITDKYKLSESEINLISSLSALHDIGKISVPESILNKPGKLTPEEWEIMKRHTIEGYEILCNANIEQNNEFMKTAKAICRYHHEKYDGKGYPDGLKGDEIPICAQVVAMADVYDALTSVRCYKRAYTHDEAIKMILAGECGAFNPLLIKCLKNVSESLRETLKIGIEQYDFHKESLHMANEILLSNDLPTENTHYMLDEEQLKRNFFESYSSKGIQFEYDALLHRIRIINNYENEDKKVLTFYSSDYKFNILSDNDKKIFIDNIKKTTKEKPKVTMKVLIQIKNVYHWHLLTAITIWSDRSDSYIGVIGQFTDIHDDVVNKGILALDDSNLKEINALKKIFPIVRIVDPKDSYVKTIDEDGKIINTKMHCYEIWNRNSCCSNCTSKRALSNKMWNSKLEIKDNVIYSILSKYISVNNNDYVLEIGFPLDDNSTNNSKNRRNLMANPLFLDFYRDTLTKAYTRTYLEDFRDVLDKSLGIALLDIDGFKEINDTYGHQIGDLALKLISASIMKSIENKGISIRYGGDEFLIVFSEIDEDSFNQIMKNIKEDISKIKIPNYECINLSASIGGAYKAKSLESAINIADKEMYRNKVKRESVKK